MPSVEHVERVAAPHSKVWPFVRDMDNWAPLVTGYQSHQKLNDLESIWTLKGELGGLTRVAEFKATISEWDEVGRVSFSLEGVTEPVTGSGVFVATPITVDADAMSGAKPSLAARAAAIRDAIARFFLNLVFRRSAPISARPTSKTKEGTELSFSLTLNAGGMAGVALNMLIAPMLKPVAEDLAARISAAVLASQAAP